MQALEYPFDASDILQRKRRIRRELLQQDGLIDKKIAIVGGSTVGEVKNILELFLLNAGIRPNTIRLSIGTEHIDDILADLEHGFAYAK